MGPRCRSGIAAAGPISSGSSKTSRNRPYAVSRRGTWSRSEAPGASAFLPPPPRPLLRLRRRQHLPQIAPGVALGDRGHILRRPLGEELAAPRPAFGPEIDHPVRRLDDVQVVL